MRCIIVRGCQIRFVFPFQLPRSPTQLSEEEGKKRLNTIPISILRMTGTKFMHRAFPVSSNRNCIHTNCIITLLLAGTFAALALMNDHTRLSVAAF